MEEIFSLDVIDTNPFQARIGEDPDHIRALADDIEQHGLMQVPMGRKVNGRVQLSFGNSRLAAMKLLAQRQGEPGSMPVRIHSFSDEEMFTHGISENLRRKQLDPIEEARAMQVYRDQFGKTSEQIGKLFNMSDSGVRGKIRLLKLPEVRQAELRRGEITEGCARSLLRLYEELDQRELEEAEGFEDELTPSVILEAAKSGSKPEAISMLVDKLIARVHPKEDAVDIESLPISREVAEQPKVAPAPIPTPAPIPAPTSTQARQGLDLHPSMMNDKARAEYEESNKAGGLTTLTVEERREFDGGSLSKQQPEPEPDDEEPAEETTEERNSPAAAETAGSPSANWERSIIYVTVTIWPGQDEDRSAMVSAYIDPTSPVIRASTVNELVEGHLINSVLSELQEKGL